MKDLSILFLLSIVFFTQGYSQEVSYNSQMIGREATGVNVFTKVEAPSIFKERILINKVSANNFVIVESPEYSPPYEARQALDDAQVIIDGTEYAYQKEGRYEVEFNASKLASGVYIYRLEANDFVDSKKMLLVK